MKKLLLIAFLAIASSVHAQTLIDKKDNFTGKRIKASSVSLGGPLNPYAGMELSFTTVSDKKYIVFTWRASSGVFGAFNNIQPNKMSLLFKMENDSIYKFKPDTVYSKIMNAANTSMIAIGSPITDKQLLQFASQKIAKFRLGILDDNGVDLDDHHLFSNKNREQVQKAAAFMIDMVVIPDEDTDK